ncbi:helix-turn-helix domain-containing protein [Halosimplex halobium]|uniref:helix-turn-helix domain-containing protein n=1 Tax=Halosimplex halobium TaxID=3396618 RepID=UPI003F543303
MPITTEFVISSPLLPLVSIPQTLEPNEIECVHGLCLERESRIYTVKFDPDDDVSEADLEALDEVVETTHLGQANGEVVFQLTVELHDRISEAFAPEQVDAAQIEPTTITSEGWHETKVFRTFEGFADFQQRCQEYDIGFELFSVSPESGADSDDSEYGLTDRQQEALTLALARGYYESPRQVSTEELAEELGISQPATSDLLRRAERQLLTTALGSDAHLNTLSR